MSEHPLSKLVPKGYELEHPDDLAAVASQAENLLATFAKFNKDGFDLITMNHAAFYSQAMEFLKLSDEVFFQSNATTLIRGYEMHEEHVIMQNIALKVAANLVWHLDNVTPATLETHANYNCVPTTSQ